MADVSELYRAIALEKTRLDVEHPEGYLFTTSIRNIGKGSLAGVVAEVSTRRAAATIVDGTHRESTVDEISKFKEQGILNSAKYAAADARRSPAQGQTLVIMPGRGSK